MGYIIPIINMDVEQAKLYLNDRIKEPKTQKRLVLVIVSIALLLDNMLYMVIVPIIPVYLRSINAYHVTHTGANQTLKNGTVFFNTTGGKVDYVGEDEHLGYLFASKAIVQILINPFSGTLIDRIGYEIPMIVGLVIMFTSTSVFALGQSYGVLFFARSLQGLGSAFADTSGLAMIADRFTEEHERSMALGIALAFISFGCLVAPPFGSVLYDFAGKPVPFLVLAIVCLIDGMMVFMVVQPKKANTEQGERLQGTPIWRLFIDPYIAVASGALIMANVSLAFLEPTIARWMEDKFEGITTWELGLIWLPAFFPHVAGVYLTVVLMKKYPQHPWLLAAVGLAMEGISCFIVPYARSFWVLMMPLCGICFGMALIDTSLLPMLGYLVDTRHVPIYGSVYAIADISYSLAYAFGPIIAGQVMAHSNFYKLNLGICLSNLFYAPALMLLRHVYVYSPFDNELQTLEGDYGRMDDNEDELGYKTIAGGPSKTYGATSATPASSYPNGEPDDIRGSAEYGYGSLDYPGGFGVKEPKIRYQEDYPQPEFPAGESSPGKRSEHGSQRRRHKQQQQHATQSAQGMGGYQEQDDLLQWN